MTAETMRRAARRLACGVALALVAGFARATPCDPSIFSPVPNCELQVQAPVTYSFWETQTYDYYCKGDHPFFWGIAAGWLVNFTWDNSCFSGIENYFGEVGLDVPNKFSGTFTNWCREQAIVVTLGCSSTPPPGTGQSCQASGGPGADPGCPQSNPQSHCSRGVVPVCYLTYTETCSDNTKYDCTIFAGISTCTKCAD